MLLRHIIQQRRAASLCSDPHKHSSIISESTGRLNCMLGWLVRVQQKRRATYRFKVIGSSGNCSEIRFFVVAWREGCERRVHWIIEKKNRLRNESGSGCLTGFPGECHSNSNTIQDFTSPFFGGTHSTRPHLLATSVSQSVIQSRCSIFIRRSMTRHPVPKRVPPNLLTNLLNDDNV